MSDFVDVKSPMHGEGQSFKMNRKDAEKYIEANPGYSLVEEEKPPEEPKAGDHAEVKAEEPTEDKALEGPNPTFRARRSER